MGRIGRYLAVVLLALLLAACRDRPQPAVTTAPTEALAPVARTTDTLEPPTATLTAAFTPTPTATWTPLPTATWTVMPTATPALASTPEPSPAGLILTVIHTNDTYGETDPCG